MCMYIHRHTCTGTRSYATWRWIYVFICIHVYVCVYTCVCIYVNISIHICIYRHSFLCHVDVDKALAEAAAANQLIKPGTYTTRLECTLRVHACADGRPAGEVGEAENIYIYIYIYIYMYVIIHTYIDI